MTDPAPARRFGGKVRALLAIAEVTWKEWAAYRSHMAVSLLTGPLRFLVMAWIWRGTAQSGSAGGMTTESLVAYSGLAILVSYAVFDFADWNLQMLVRTGRYVNHLLQPLPHPLFALGQKLGHRALALLIEALPVWALVSVALGRPLVPSSPFWFALSVVQGFVLMFLANYTVGLLGFWMARAEGLRRCLMLLRDTLAGAWLPLSFFPAAMVPFLFLLPYPWILYVPLRIGLGEVEIAGRILSAPAAVGLQSLAMVAWIAILAGARSFATRRFLAVGG